MTRGRVDRRSLRGGQRQADREEGPLSFLRFHRDLAGVTAHDTEGHAQSQAVAAFALGREERLKEAMANRWSNADARVAHRQAALGLGLPGTDRNRAAA